MKIGKSIATAILCCAIAHPASAQTQADKHALGNMYTKVLNMMEAQGMLDTLDPRKTAAISDIHMDHGQVFVTLTAGNGTSVTVFDPIANRIIK